MFIQLKKFGINNAANRKRMMKMTIIPAFSHIEEKESFT